MNASHYCRILNANLTASATALDLGPDFVFQQDNDPKHTAIITKKFFAENNITVLDWPSQSPDLNPIEHLWAILEKQLGERRFKTKDQLKEALRMAWSNIEVQQLRSLVESMPRRLAAIIKARGGPTKY